MKTKSTVPHESTMKSELNLPTFYISASEVTE